MRQPMPPSMPARPAFKLTKNIEIHRLLFDRYHSFTLEELRGYIATGLLKNNETKKLSENFKESNVTIEISSENMPSEYSDKEYAESEVIIRYTVQYPNPNYDERLKEYEKQLLSYKKDLAKYKKEQKLYSKYIKEEDLKRKKDLIIKLQKEVEGL